MNTMTRTMRPLRQQIVRLSVSLGLAASLAGGFAVPAFAADIVTQQVNPGAYAASVADLSLGAVGYSHAAQAQTGSMTLTANDSTGSGLGWKVTVLTSEFDLGGTTDASLNIGAANFSLTSAAAPASTAGQAVDVTNGPKVPTESPVGTLDAARKVIQANAAFGQGTYTQALAVSLAIPAQARAGTYTGTLTTTIAAAP